MTVTAPHNDASTTTTRRIPALPTSQPSTTIQYYPTAITMFKFRLTILYVFLYALIGGSTAFLVPVAEEQEIEVIANPHDAKRTCQAAPVEKLLQPNQLILHPMITQSDTFQELTYAKVLTVPVPVYSMKQPARLSAAELEFQLVLVKELGQSSAEIQEVPFPMEKAMDSWFSGYFWAPLVMPCGESSSWKHVGWKFTALDEDAQYSHFYALMVQIDTQKQAQAVRSIGGFKAPGWMVAALRSQ